MPPTKNHGPYCPLKLKVLESPLWLDQNRPNLPKTYAERCILFAFKINAVLIHVGLANTAWIYTVNAGIQSAKMIIELLALSFHWSLFLTVIQPWCGVTQSKTTPTERPLRRKTRQNRRLFWAAQKPEDKFDKCPSECVKFCLGLTMLCGAGAGELGDLALRSKTISCGRETARARRF